MDICTGAPNDEVTALVIMLVSNILISTVLVQSLILNQSKVFLAAQDFLSK